MISIQSQRHLLSDISLDAMLIGDMLEVLQRARTSQQRELILYHNLHSLYLYQTRPAFKKLYSKASWIYIDGIPVVWLGRAVGLPLKSTHRITFLDCFDVILDKAVECGCRIYYLGSSAEVNVKGLSLLRTRHPTLTLDGHHGYFAKSGAQNEDVIAAINSFKPDVLFVGMGMPIQEEWLLTNCEKLNVSVIFTSGSTLDYITGDAYQPPSWVGPLGLYGIARLISEPRKLWRRYLIEPLILLRYLVVPMMRQRVRPVRSIELSEPWS